MFESKPGALIIKRYFIIRRNIIEKCFLSLIKTQALLKKIQLLLLIIFTLSFLNVKGQHYIFRNYSVEDGIAQSQVYAALQDKRGNLWFGTQGGGLTRFDGIKFKTYTEKDGLINNTVNHIKEDPKGNLWIATKNGLSYFNGITFQNYQYSGNRSLRISQIDIDPTGKLWLATSEGLFTFQNGKFANYSNKLGLKSSIINTVLVSDERTIYFGDTDGLYKISLSSNEVKLTDMRKQSRFMNNAITSLKKDKNGVLWIGTFGDGLYGYNGKTFYRIDLKHELYKSSVLDIFTDRDQQLWIATLNKGVLKYDPNNGTFQQFSEAEGLSSKHIRCVIQDNAGNFWFGTSGGGVCNYLGKQFTTFNSDSGIKGKLIYTIFRDSKNNLWIGTDKGVSLNSNGLFQNYATKEGFLDIQVKAITEAGGMILIGTEGKGLYTVKDSVFTKIEALKGTHIRSMITDKDSNIWIATAGNGLFRMKLGKDGVYFENFMVKDGLLSNRITSLLEDQQGNIWYGTEKDGAGKIDRTGKHLKKYTTSKGLSSNEIISLAEDKFGNIWLGTLGAGLNCITRTASESVKKFGYEKGLTSTIAYLLVFDQQGNLIVGSEKGLDYLFIENETQIKGIKHYTRGDGFTGVETCRNAVFSDLDRTIWFGTINGLIKYNPANNKRNDSAPILSVTDIKLYYKSISETPYKNHIGDWNKVNKLKLPYDQNHITFDFFAVNLSNPDAVRYKWKLEGFDDRWSPVSTERSILYSNLNPGDYVFLVKACNEDSVWTEVPYRVSFSIAAPFWYNWWFIVLCLISIFLIIFFFIRLRIERIKRKAKEERNKIQLEKEIVELEQKALRLQMNPHFIFNALNSIQSQIGTGNDKEARYYLAKFSRLMRQILDNSRNTTITLQEEILMLENYLLIEKFCNGDRFDYTIETDDELEIDFIRIPPMILQPFVENAIKHGFRNMEETGRRAKIKITFNEIKGMLECMVEDNGIGRMRSEELNKNSKETYHRSTALLVTRERLELMGELPGHSSLEIVDLYENKTPNGTRVIVRIPLI